MLRVTMRMLLRSDRVFVLTSSVTIDNTYSGLLPNKIDAWAQANPPADFDD
jgi:hypothetical protein